MDRVGEYRSLKPGESEADVVSALRYVFVTRPTEIGPEPELPLEDYFRAFPAEFQAVDPEVLAQIIRSREDITQLSRPHDHR